jgi:hypothetical protein
MTTTGRIASDKRRQHAVPVGDVLAEELLHAERDRMRIVARGEDQREPEIVPDRHDGEDRDGGDRRPQQRRDHLEEDARLRHAVAARRVAQILRDLLDEFGQDEDRHRQPLRDIDEDQRGQRVVETAARIMVTIATEPSRIGTMMPIDMIEAQRVEPRNRIR